MAGDDFIWPFGCEALFALVVVSKMECYPVLLTAARDAR